MQQSREERKAMSFVGARDTAQGAHEGVQESPFRVRKFLRQSLEHSIDPEQLEQASIELHRKDVVAVRQEEPINSRRSR